LIGPGFLIQKSVDERRIVVGYEGIATTLKATMTGGSAMTLSSQIAQAECSYISSLHSKPEIGRFRMGHSIGFSSPS